MTTLKHNWYVYIRLFSLTGDNEPSLLARTSHSAVIWGEYMVVYGGYRFPLGDGRADVGSGAGSGEGSGERDHVEQAEDVLLYHFATHTWEVLEAQNDTRRPETRYGHSAVVYDVSRLSDLCVMGTSFPGSYPAGNEVVLCTHA